MLLHALEPFPHVPWQLQLASWATACSLGGNVGAGSVISDGQSAASRLRMMSTCCVQLLGTSDGSLALHAHTCQHAAAGATGMIASVWRPLNISTYQVADCMCSMHARGIRPCSAPLILLTNLLGLRVKPKQPCHRRCWGGSSPITCWWFDPRWGMPFLGHCVVAQFGYAGNLMDICISQLQGALVSSKAHGVELRARGMVACARDSTWSMCVN